MALIEKKEEKPATFQELTLTPDQIALVKRTVAKGADDDELKMFLYIAKKSGLDPFKREIWFVKYKDKKGNWHQYIKTARDGYLKMARNDPKFKGIMSFAVREYDDFQIDAANEKVTHIFGKGKRGEIVGAWAKCKKEGVSPQIVYVEFTEYVCDSPTWKQYPSMMIQKVAEENALKRMFGIDGLVTSEAMEVSEIKNGYRDEIQYGSTDIPNVEESNGGTNSDKAFAAYKELKEKQKKDPSLKIPLWKDFKEDFIKKLELHEFIEKNQDEWKVDWTTEQVNSGSNMSFDDYQKFRIEEAIEKGLIKI